jgi:hypothetical protein
VHAPAALWVTVSEVPAIVNVADRGLVEVFAETE